MHTFLATQGATATTFNVFDDVTWGVQLAVPELAAS
jgi:hypothetical protein